MSADVLRDPPPPPPPKCTHPKRPLMDTFSSLRKVWCDVLLPSKMQYAYARLLSHTTHDDPMIISHAHAVITSQSACHPRVHPLPFRFPPTWRVTSACPACQHLHVRHACHPRVHPLPFCFPPTPMAHSCTTPDTRVRWRIRNIGHVPKRVSRSWPFPTPRRHWFMYGLRLTAPDLFWPLGSPEMTQQHPKHISHANNGTDNLKFLMRCRVSYP